LIAAQRAAGEAPCATLKEQLRPSALLAALPAAKAALVALMQITNNAAAAISIVNLMASLPFWRHTFATHAPAPGY
jgi:ABC-type arginine/histidine transport system permease subunit